MVQQSKVGRWKICNNRDGYWNMPRGGNEPLSFCDKSPKWGCSVCSKTVRYFSHRKGSMVTRVSNVMGDRFNFASGPTQKGREFRNRRSPHKPTMVLSSEEYEDYCARPGRKRNISNVFDSDGMISFTITSQNGRDSKTRYGTCSIIWNRTSYP